MRLVHRFYTLLTWERAADHGWLRLLFPDGERAADRDLVRFGLRQPPLSVQEQVTTLAFAQYDSPFKLLTYHAVRGRIRGRIDGGGIDFGRRGALEAPGGGEAGESQAARLVDVF